MKLVVMAFALLGAGTSVAATTSAQQNIDAFTKDIAATTDKEKLSELYFQRGFLYSQANAFKEGADDYTRVIKLRPKTSGEDLDMAFVYYFRGLNYEALNLNTKALDDLNKSISIWPKDKNQDYLANAYYHRGKVQQPGTLPEKEKEETAEQSQAKILASNKSTRDDATEALRLWPATADPSFKAEILFMRGVCYFGGGERQLALNDIEDALLIMPDSHNLQQMKLAILRAMKARGESPQ
ncbi:MAG: tetratricopeptide repeat protein [Parvibaculaceae bacterium]